MLNQLRKFRDTFHGSEVIIWARAQLIIGAAFVALQGVDVSAFITDKHLLQYYIFANGLITEMLRRNREDWKQ